MGQFTLSEISKINKLVDSRKKLYQNTQEIKSMYEASRMMYSDDSAFVLELMQNADDCAASKVEIWLNNSGFIFNHNGKCFDLDDIEQITKASQDENKKANDDSRIGRFGIGFKSVFNITDKPQITSGKYQFELQDYIIPNFIIPNIEGEISDLTYAENIDTSIQLPYSDVTVFDKVKDKLEYISGRYLLFLNHIVNLKMNYEDQEIILSKEKITSVFFDMDQFNDEFKQLVNAGIVTVYKIANQVYLVIDGRIIEDQKETGGYYKNIKIAFEVSKNSDGSINFRYARNSNFNVFFPTNTPTGLGYLIQGNYTVGMSRKELNNASQDFLSDKNNSEIINITLQILTRTIDLFAVNKIINKSFIKVVLGWNTAPDSLKIKLEETFINYFSNHNKVLLSENCSEIENIIFVDEEELKTIFKASDLYEDCDWVDNQYIEFFSFFSKIQGIKLLNLEKIIEHINADKDILQKSNIENLYKYLLNSKRRNKIENLEFIKTSDGNYFTIKQKIYLENQIANLEEIKDEINKETNLTFYPIFIDEELGKKVGSILKLGKLGYSSVLKYIEEEFFVTGNSEIKNIAQYFGGFNLILKLMNISQEEIELKNIPIIVKNEEGKYFKEVQKAVYFIEDNDIKSLYMKANVFKLNNFVDNDLYNKYVPAELKDELKRFFIESKIRKKMFDLKVVKEFSYEFYSKENRQIFNNIPKPIQYTNTYTIYNPMIKESQRILEYLSQSGGIEEARTFMKLVFKFFEEVKYLRGYIEFFYKKKDTAYLAELDFISMLKDYSWIVIDGKRLKPKQITLKILKEFDYVPTGYREQLLFSICALIGIDKGEYSKDVRDILSLLKSRSSDELAIINSEILKIIINNQNKKA